MTMMRLVAATHQGFPDMGYNLTQELGPLAPVAMVCYSHLPMRPVPTLVIPTYPTAEKKFVSEILLRGEIRDLERKINHRSNGNNRNVQLQIMVLKKQLSAITG